MADERVAAGQPVPRGAVETADPGGQLGDELGFAIGHRRVA